MLRPCLRPCSHSAGASARCAVTVRPCGVALNAAAPRRRAPVSLPRSTAAGSSQPRAGGASAAPGPQDPPEYGVADSTFFNRVIEVQQMLARIKAQPRAVTLVLGPRNCGKSALVKEVVRQLAVADPTRPVSWVDAMKTSIRTPGELAKLILLGQLTIQDLLKRSTAAIDGASTPLAIAEALNEAVDNLAAHTVGDVLVAYKGLLAADKKPAVLIIDEANLLRQWLPEHKVELKTLMRYFISVAKQDMAAHVFLFTTESSFYGFLLEQMGAGYFEPFVLGEFPKEEAREFLRQLGGSDRWANDAFLVANFEQIYEVCGGNAGALGRFAAAYAGDMEMALITVCWAEGAKVREACRPCPTHGWTSAQFHTVMGLLCTNRYGAVPQEDMVAALGPGGDTVVRALVDAHILSVRPCFTEWERQLPREAWGENGPKALVTAATAPHMYAIRQAWAKAQLAAKQAGGRAGQGK